VSEVVHEGACVVCVGQKGPEGFTRKGVGGWKVVDIVNRTPSRWGKSCPRTEAAPAMVETWAVRAIMFLHARRISETSTCSTLRSPDVASHMFFTAAAMSFHLAQRRRSP